MTKQSEEQISNSEKRLTKQIGVTLAKYPRTYKAGIAGLIIILIFFGGFGLWAYLAPLESAAIAPGKVVVAGNRRTIQHLEGGIVEAINVRDGSKVKKGDILITLDNTQSKVSVDIVRNELYELSGTEARLLAELQNAQKLEFPKLITENQNDFKVAQIMENQTAIFNANKRSFTSNINILKQRIGQLQQQIEGIESQLTSNKEQLRLIKLELKDVVILAKKKLIERSRLLALQREQASLIGKEGENVAQLATLKQKIGETDLQIIALEDKQRKELLDELRDVREKKATALEKEKSASDIFRRSVIRAPISGTVVGLRVHTIGGVIKAGEPIMDIVPQNEELIIEANISPLDIDVVHAGLLAKVQLSALKLRTTLTLLGKVTYVSPDALQDEKTGQAYYQARIVIDKQELKKISGYELYPGMPAEVMVITNRLTPWQYFIDPIKRSFHRAFKES